MGAKQYKIGGKLINELTPGGLIKAGDIVPGMRNGATYYFLLPVSSPAIINVDYNALNQSPILGPLANAQYQFTITSFSISVVDGFVGGTSILIGTTGNSDGIAEIDNDFLITGAQLDSASPGIDTSSLFNTALGNNTQILISTSSTLTAGNFNIAFNFTTS